PACRGSDPGRAGPSGPTPARTALAPSSASRSGLSGRRRRRFFRGAVRPERSGHRELTEPVAHHVLGHVDRDELLAVVDGESVAHELRRDRRAPRPGLEYFLLSGSIQI